eukprot:CAMPEP_0194549220 /NCGR_PEP_ID=MMETSP0253-20130528/94899_1 /TAXON_ID=2966 /ORGANISM="Noctiluca scintillans" /LENGTH=104 /DNA_ID=CAMNT_0039396631 /DNA_START=206 /DNA_END=520 /DNA_ORIENTATION=-
MHQKVQNGTPGLRPRAHRQSTGHVRPILHVYVCSDHIGLLTSLNARQASRDAQESLLATVQDISIRSDVLKSGNKVGSLGDRLHNIHLGIFPSVRNIMRQRPTV